MYSLYRAWLTLNPCGPGLPPLPPPVPLNLSLPPPGQVPDAPDVSLQVGPSMTHFSAHRGVLSAHSGFFKAALINHAGLAPISVPNVNVDEFSSLLTFMYTGYLDLNVTNIYSILLATHILHMPGALEMCRNFLLQHGHNNNNNNNSEAAPQQHQHQQQQQRVNIIKPIASRKLTPSMQEFFGSPSHDQAEKHQSPSKSKKIELGETEKKIKTGKKQRSNEANCSTSSSNNIINISNNTNKDKVIVDVACCDGPVRFHRVINKNYGQNEENRNGDGSDDQPTYSASDFNKAMNENMMEKLTTSGNEIFTCPYCNHTFKSQYCYQKHARRHLYPVSVDKTETKREVKLLDMNVQYYPCKTCGSKFPSYYFVHKHRKMCHADEVADKNHKNNEIVMENVTGNTSSCSAIDVEAVQNEDVT